MRFVKQAGRGINRFSMVGDGERILLGISGGKDSLALALALRLRLKWIPINYRLEAVLIDWKEYPLSCLQKQRLVDLFSTLEIPLDIISVTMFPHSFQGRFDCYLCSRNRKRILFEEARQRSISKIALGHHMDDIIETTLMNICLHGNIATMVPYQEFFTGELAIIRPLCEVKERMIDNISGFLDLPVCKVDCPFDKSNVRVHFKPFIKQLSRINKRVRENIYAAPFHIDYDYLPSEK